MRFLKQQSLSLPQFIHAIDLSSTSFAVNGVFYEQIFGNPMGSPLSPILADLVMDDLKSCCLQFLKKVATLKFEPILLENF